ncbi:uncharacterized protein LOC132260432 [Phlebotomus argentipes]|uniref:uncharacterized protein LOC132260432 n=1 Tax=Phlebotomus argentipes TaxID=94469 RepID=UPI0028932ED9|nr:uncharacterized protein LOC132260432 [Phlebotomus argentipes]
MNPHSNHLRTIFSFTPQITDGAYLRFCLKIFNAWKMLGLLRSSSVRKIGSTSRSWIDMAGRKLDAPEDLKSAAMEKITESVVDMAVHAPMPNPPKGPDRQNYEMKEAFRKFKEKQKKFQKNDGLPVFLKAGLRDRILFGLTVGLAMLGLGLQVKFYTSLK